jgi:molecular chaperone GrpE (heat shock protein)
MILNNKNDKQEQAKIKVVIGALIFYEGKLFLGKDNGKWAKKWIIPGGKMDFGESIEEAIKREVKEETGLEIEVKKIGEVKSIVKPKEFHDKNTHFVMIDCISEAKSDKVKLDKREIADYKWVKPEEALEEDLLEYSRKPIENYLKDISKKDYLAGWQRCKADFENYKSKVEERMKENQERAKENLVLEMMPVLDNFNLAINHIPEEDQAKSWIQGIFYIKKQLEDFLANFQISEIEALNKEFDPNFHESIENVEVKDEKQKGKVIEVMQKGYQKGDRVIRAAKVKVGQ